jgi:hypothetical protein
LPDAALNDLDAVRQSALYLLDEALRDAGQLLHQFGILRYGLDNVDQRQNRCGKLQFATSKGITKQCCCPPMTIQISIRSPQLSECGAQALPSAYCSRSNTPAFRPSMSASGPVPHWHKGSIVSMVRMCRHQMAAWRRHAAELEAAGTVRDRESPSLSRRAAARNR